MTVLSQLFTALALLLCVPIVAFELPCSAVSGTPCRCPFSLTYAESATTAFIPAPAKDVGAMMNDFFNLTWSGRNIVSTQGPDNIPLLAQRKVSIITSIGTYEIPQRLIIRYVLEDGSFSQTYAQEEPVKYQWRDGFFHGYWATIQGTRYFQNQTMVTISNYACQTGHPSNFAAHHKMMLQNVARLLGPANMSSLAGIETISVQSF
ncbi:hypothetical protein GGR57DRAFT_515536 [Xylariaceae sp. FL1272]|nr:hypothetical protein GGR57DRAFT_515536 [Xylariaceae sp. FL1272]